MRHASGTRDPSVDGSIIFATEQLQVDRFRHRAMAKIVRVYMVAAVIFGSQTCRQCGIAQNRVEVDDRIVLAAFTNEAIDELTFLFHDRRPEAGKREAVYRR